MRKVSMCMLATVAVMSACGGGGATGPGTELGTYQLVSVDGESVPVILKQGEAVTVALVSGSLRLFAGGAMDRERTVNTTLRGEANVLTQTDHGRYTIMGTQLVILLDDGTREVGSVEGADLSLLSDGHELGYRRQ